VRILVTSGVVFLGLVVMVHAAWAAIRLMMSMRGNKPGKLIPWLGPYRTAAVPKVKPLTLIEKLLLGKWKYKSESEFSPSRFELGFPAKFRLACNSLYVRGFLCWHDLKITKEEVDFLYEHCNKQLAELNASRDRKHKERAEIFAKRLQKKAEELAQRL